MGCRYYATKKAWMTSSLFQEIIQDMNIQFKKETRKCLLLVDGADTLFSFLNWVFMSWIIVLRVSFVQALMFLRKDLRKLWAIWKLSGFRLIALLWCNLSTKASFTLSRLILGTFLFVLFFLCSILMKNLIKFVFCSLFSVRHHFLTVFSQAKLDKLITVLQAIVWLASAWKIVSPATIRHC